MTHATRSGRRGSGIWVNKQRKVGGGGLLEVMQEKAIKARREQIQQRKILLQEEMCTVTKINGKAARGNPE